VDSRSSSVVPEWDNRSPVSVPACLPALAGRCIRPGKHPVDAQWEWAHQALCLRRLRPRRDAPVVPLADPDNVTFHAA